MSRIKLFGLGARKPTLSAEEFHDHWRHPHGTWARQMTTLRAYVQSHQIDSSLLGASQNRFEMVAEMWLDRMEDLLNFRQEPVLVKYLLADEDNFIDMANSLFLATEEQAVISHRQDSALGPADDLWSVESRPISIKLLRFVAALESDESGTDAALAKSLGALRYTRCVALAGYHRESAPFAGVHEYWWPTVRAFRMGVDRAPSAWEALDINRRDALSLLVQAERLL